MEQFGVLIIFGLIALFQLVVRWIRTRAAVGPPPAPVAHPAPTSPPPPGPAELLARSPVRPLALGVEEFVRPGAHRVARAPRGRLLGSRADLRRAIVLMEVLGPSRGTSERQAPPR